MAADTQDSAQQRARTSRTSLRRGWRAFMAQPRPIRVAAYAAAALALVLVLALLTAVVVARTPLPDSNGSETLPGLDATVDVVRDAQGVPQVYADTVEDLWRAQGYLTASERFFQMDVRRHVAAGRLAEIFGAEAVPGDRLARTLGWERTARAELALVEPDTRTALASYAEGVNAYLDSHGPSRIAVEYTLLNAAGLDYRPEPWSEIDSLAWLKTLAWEIGGNLEEEIERASTVAAVGERVVGDLFPPAAEALADPVVTQGAVVDGVYEQDAERSGTRNPLRPGFGPPRTRTTVAATPVARVLRRTGRALETLPTWVARGAGRGSNAWAVAGDRSVTGAPLLANDPHLDASLPGTWLQIGLHCRDVGAQCPYDVAGFSLPGVPGVVVGHNASVAWGMTSLGADVKDLFVERVRGGTYRYAGEDVPLRTRTETIRVAGADDETLTVRSTRHGPLLSDLDPAYADLADTSPLDSRRALDQQGREQEHAVAVQWTGLRTSATADAILELDRAGDWDDFREALAQFALPALGFVYADTDGHIGFQAAGRVPVRMSGNDGVLPVAGWRAENDWTGRSVPYDGLPSVLDPASGVVVAANQAVVGGDYPYLLTGTPDPGYRARRIAEALGVDGADPATLTLEEMVELQGDTHEPLAEVLVPYLLDVPLADGYDSDGQRLLAAWDGSQPAEGDGSAAAAYFNAVWRDLLTRTFGDELPTDLAPDGGARWAGVVERLLAEPRSPWWDDLETDTVRESRDDVLAASLQRARDDLTRTQAVDPAEWTWGDAHELSLVNEPYGRWGNDAVRRLLNRSAPAGGSGRAVDATDWDAAASGDPFEVTTAPTMRMVVSLADLDDSRWVSLAGVSGHPGSGHYADQLDAWGEGRTLAWPFTPEAVRAAEEDRLTLEPGE